ncbi:MAG: hypothetical protein H6839_17715 [Planctomycetes bacterium]|nr:hypothetical protein [Planctomycetota bacterium]
MSRNETPKTSGMREALFCCLVVPLLAVGTVGGVVASCYYILVGLNPSFAL